MPFLVMGTPPVIDEAVLAQWPDCEDILDGMALNVLGDEKALRRPPSRNVGVFGFRHARALTTLQNFGASLPSYEEGGIDQKVLFNAIVRRFANGTIKLVHWKDLEPRECHSIFNRLKAGEFFPTMNTRLKDLLKAGAPDLMIARGPEIPLPKAARNLKSGVLLRALAHDAPLQRESAEENLATLMQFDASGEEALKAYPKFVLMLRIPERYSGVGLFLTIIHELVHYLDYKTLRLYDELRESNPGLPVLSVGEEAAILEARAYSFEFFTKPAIMAALDPRAAVRPHSLNYLDYFFTTVISGRYPQAYDFLRGSGESSEVMAVQWRPRGIARFAEIETIVAAASISQAEANGHGRP